MKHPLGWLGFLLIGAPLLAQPRAERIFVNGVVWTGVPGRPLAQAIAVRRGRLLLVGDNDQVRGLANVRTDVVDLGGRLVVPGFNDAHWHLQTRERVDLSGSGSVEEIRRRLAAFGKENPTGWIEGNGWVYTDFPDRIPDRKYFDGLFPDRPVYLTERDGHMGVANSRALAMAGIVETTPDPPHGRIERDPSGRLTGEFKEYAQDLVQRHIPPPGAAEILRSITHVTDRAASFGLTSLQIASAVEPAALAAIEKLNARRRLKTRLRIAVSLEKRPRVASLRRQVALRDRFPGPMIKFGIAKGMLDGTVDAKTAAMFSAYVGTKEDTGIPMWTQADLDATVAAYDRAGLQVQLHAIGDKAIRMALDAYANAARVNGTSNRRHRIEHVEVPLAEDYPRFKSLGVIASTQALFATPDATTLDHYAVLLGPERAARANAFKRFDDAGAVQAFGSDYPVFSMEVLRGIHTAVTRTTMEGTPAGGWHPENRLSVEAALRHFSVDAAYASFDETVKGTLEPSKLADFVVLSDNILEIPADRIRATRVLRTVLSGKDTFRAP